MLNYFTEDAMNLAAGARADCQGSRIDNDATINTAARAGAAQGLKICRQLTLCLSQSLHPCER